MSFPKKTHWNHVCRIIGKKFECFCGEVYYIILYIFFDMWAILIKLKGKTTRAVFCFCFYSLCLFPWWYHRVKCKAHMYRKAGFTKFSNKWPSTILGKVKNHIDSFRLTAFYPKQFWLTNEFAFRHCVYVYFNAMYVYTLHYTYHNHITQHRQY